MSGFAFREMPSGGRRLESPSTPLGRGWCEWDAAGNVIGNGLEAATPPPTAVPTPTVSSAELRLAADRLDTCATCPEFRGANVLTVRCHGCGCGALSLRTGVCKLGKWPTQA